MAKKPLVNPLFANLILLYGLIGGFANTLRFFDIIQFSDQLFFASLGLLGIAFIIEGAVIATLSRIRDGLTPEEIVHIITIGLGLFLVGIAAIGLITGDIPITLLPIVGFASGISLLITILQTFVVRQ